MKQFFLKNLYVLICIGMFSSTLEAAIIPVTSSAPVNSVPIAINPIDVIREAIHEFRSLNRKERRERFKELKKQLKEFKKQKRANAEPSTNTILLVILAILLPPLAVYLHEGQINSKFWISLLLTLLFWLPGVIYALIVVLGKG